MQVNCPTCKKQVEWNAQSPFRPFCSKRCQLIDLGEWSEQKMAIPASDTPTAAPQLPDVEEVEAMLAQQGEDFFKN